MAKPTEYPRVLSIVDAPADVQRWADAFIERARLSAGVIWPHPHDDLPTTVITLATLWRCVEEGFTVNNVPWSIAKRGLPPLARIAGQDADTPEDVQPTMGSSYHNLLHSLLGDFH